MASETKSEKLKAIMQRSVGLTDNEGCFADIVQSDVDDYAWLVKQAELALELEQSNPVHVIKRRNGKATIIRWNDERYVFQSESAARGGVSYAKGQARKT